MSTEREQCVHCRSHRDGDDLSWCLTCDWFVCVDGCAEDCPRDSDEDECEDDGV